MKKIVTVTIILLGLVLLTVMSFYPPIAERVNQWIASAGILGAVLLAVLGNHFSDLFKGSSPDSQSQGTTTTANVYDTEGAITKHLKFYDECYGRDELAETLFKKLNADSGCSVHAILADAGMGKSAFLAKCSASFKKYKSSGDLVLFYPFRASDPVLNKPRNLYLHLLKELGEIGLQGSPSASELNRKLHSKLQKWGEVNEGKKIFILVDAIEEAETPSEIPKEEESHPMPILFEDGHQHLSHCRLLFTVRGKSGQPVSGQVTHQWFNSTKKEKILKLDPIDDAGLQEWVFDSLPTTFFDDEKKQLQEAILNKTKETDHYPLYINHILQEICAIKGENSTFKEISEFVQTLPCSLVDYATEKFRRMRRGRDRETITLLACAKDLLAQSILGIRKNSLPSNIARWVMLSAGSDGKAEFQHALYKQWFEEHVRSLPPWWCPIASVWKWRAKLPSCFSIRRVSSKLPPRLALWRVKMFGTPYEKTHRKLAQLCADKNSRYDQKHLIYHSVESGDWKTVHDKLTDLGYIEERAKAGQTYELLDDYNHALDNWPGYERYSPFKEYHVPKWEQKLILTRIKVILTRIKERGYPEYAGNGKWPTDGHKETCLRMLFADHCSHNEIDPFAEAMEKCLEGRVELFFQFVRECASAIAHAKEFPTVVVEQALRRSKTGIVASVAKKISDKWDRDKKPYLRYLEYSREEKVASRPYTLLNLEGHSSGVYHVALTPDGKRAVSASWDNTLKVWDLESGACLKTLEGHSGGVNHVAITPDGERAVSASNDKTLKVWDLESGKLKNSFFCKGIKALCWNGEGDLIVAEVDGLTLRFAKIRLGSQNTLFFANALYASEEKAVYYCPHCGAEQSVPPRALTCIEGLKKQNPTTYEKGHSPCIELPSEVWEAEGLLKDEKGDGYCCPSCKHPIRFNPWIVEEWTPADSSDAAKPSQGSDEDQGSSDVII